MPGWREMMPHTLSTVAGTKLGTCSTLSSSFSWSRGITVSMVLWRGSSWSLCIAGSASEGGGCRPGPWQAWCCEVVNCSWTWTASRHACPGTGDYAAVLQLSLRRGQVQARAMAGTCLCSFRRGGGLQLDLERVTACLSWH